MWIEVPGRTNWGGINYPTMQQMAIVDPAVIPTVTQHYYIPQFTEVFAAYDVENTDMSKHSRIACLQPHADLAAGGPGSSVNLFFTAYYPGVSISGKFSFLNALPAPQTAECRDAIITSDKRYFYFIQRFDGSTKYMQILEATYNSGMLDITQTKLEAYVTSSFSYSYWKIIEQASGSHSLMYSISAKQLEGRTARPFHINYLMKGTLLSQSSAPVLSSLSCAQTAVSLGSLSLSLTVSSGYPTLGPGLAFSYFHLDFDDDPSRVWLQNKPLVSIFMNEQGCPANYPSTPMPKFIPYVDEYLHYVIG